MEPEEYAKMSQAEARMWWYRAVHARLLDALTEQPGPILDAGCGTGGFLALLRRARPSQETFGLEWHALAACLAAEKSGRPIARGSINTLPFAAGVFGTVIATDVLCHAAVDPPAALAEVRRVLRPGGRLIVNMPAFMALMSAHDTAVHNIRRQTARETRAMLEAAGFRIVRLGYWNGLLLPLMFLRRKVFTAPPARSDVATFPPWVDGMFHAMTELERRLPFALPAGGSVLAIAERP